MIVYKHSTPRSLVKSLRNTTTKPNNENRVRWPRAWPRIITTNSPEEVRLDASHTNPLPSPGGDLKAPDLSRRTRNTDNTVRGGTTTRTVTRTGVTQGPDTLWTSFPLVTVLVNIVLRRTVMCRRDTETWSFLSEFVPKQRKTKILKRRRKSKTIITRQNKWKYKEDQIKIKET